MYGCFLLQTLLLKFVQIAYKKAFPKESEENGNTFSFKECFYLCRPTFRFGVKSVSWSIVFHLLIRYEYVNWQTSLSLSQIHLPKYLENVKNNFSLWKLQKQCTPLSRDIDFRMILINLKCQHTATFAFCIVAAVMPIFAWSITPAWSVWGIPAVSNTGS